MAEGSFEVEHRGETVTVHWRTDQRMIEVRCGFRTKRTQLGGSPPQALARLMAREVLPRPEDA